MLLCMKTLGCNKLDGHRSPCEKRVVKITPELVTISYRKDDKDYLLSMPTEHAEWAEEMLNLNREAIERSAAEKALTLFADEEELEFNRLLASMPDVFSGLSKERHQKRDEAWERRRSAIRARARAEACRQERGEQ